MKVLHVEYHGSTTQLPMGRLTYLDHVAQFEFDPAFLASGINPSPFILKPLPGLLSADRTPFNGLFGLFNDSLPDGWGLYLMDKVFRQHGINPETVTPIDRLAFMGNRTLGALTYRPDEGAPFFTQQNQPIDLDVIATQAAELYAGEASEVLDELAANGTPSGGARPKMLVGIDDQKHLISGPGELPDGYERWIVKFPTGTRPIDRAEGAVEYVYSLMAKEAGLVMPDTQLIAGKRGAYFAIKRFDLDNSNQRLHMHSLAGLMHLDFRVPNFDYQELMKVCSALTRDHSERERLFRLMAFNVLTGNRDDHAKNFSFVLRPNNIWQLSPAYDLTYNQGINGEHTMAVCGHGKNIPLDALLQAAKTGSIQPKRAKIIIGEVVEAVAGWKQTASQFAIPASFVNDVALYVDKQIKTLNS